MSRTAIEALESRRYLYELGFNKTLGTEEGDYVHFELDFVNAPNLPNDITIDSGIGWGYTAVPEIDFFWDGSVATVFSATNDDGTDITISWHDGLDPNTTYWDPVVANVAPTATFNASGTILITGQTLTVGFSGQSDPSSADVSAGFTYSFDFDNDYNFSDPGESSGSSTSSQYAFGTPGTKVIVGRIADKDGGYNDYLVTVTVSGVAAKFTNDGPVSTNSTATVKFSSPFSIDESESFTYSFDWDNNGTFEVNGSSSPTASTTFGSPGTKVVRGRIADSESNTQDYYTTITVTNTAPSAPTGLAATVVSAERIDLSWKKTSNTDAYYIDYATASNFAGATTIDTNARINKWSVTGLTENTTYYFRIRSYNSVGSSSNSSPINTTTLKKKSLRESRSTSLVKDVNPAPGSSPANLTVFNNALFFTATTSSSGRELWKTNGTSSGTTLVADINSGAASSSPDQLLVIGTTLFFTADDGTNGRELWKYTVAGGAEMVENIRASSASSSPAALANVNGTLYFTADNGTTGHELWKSGGHSTNTDLIRDIRAGGDESEISEITYVGGGIALLSANDGSNGQALWKTDGSSSGTTLLKDYNNTTVASPEHLTAINGVVYFSADDGSHGVELWKSDGASSGTKMVEDIMEGSVGSNPKELVNLNGTLFFTASNEYYGNPDGDNNREVWRSDGTTGGTRLFQDLFQASIPWTSFPKHLTAINNQYLVWQAGDGRYVTSRELFISDGSEYANEGADPYDNNGLGRFAMIDLQRGYFPGAQPVNFVGDPDFSVIYNGFADQIQVASGKLFFFGNDYDHGFEPWKLQANLEPRQLADVYPGSPGSTGADASTAAATEMIYLHGRAYFAADDGSHGLELWRTDGTATGTVLVKDIHTGNSGSSATDLVDIGGTLYFAASGNDSSGASVGTELWRSDGTSAGTTLVRDILSGSGSSSPSGFTRLGDTSTFLFSASDGNNGHELWISDGTSAGTSMLEDIKTGGGSSSPGYLFPFTFGGDDYVLFNADNGSTGVELWISDGTSLGTQLLKDIVSGSGSSHSLNFTAMTVSGTPYAFFQATTASEGTELWRTDGTGPGTTMVRDIRPGASGSIGQERAVMSVSGTPHLFFWANDGANGVELWKSDGTSAGTVLVKDINPGSNWSYVTSPSPLVVIGNTLYFAATDGTNGVELWSSNGTSAGTAMLKNINSGASSSSPANLTVAGSSLYFTASDGSNGTELWITDGTSPGTMMLKDINSGAGNSSPANLTNIDGRLYFSATDGSGTELWASDGTSTGTSLVSDIRSGASSSSPASLTKVGSEKLFFLADDGSHGQELWLASGFDLGSAVVDDTVPGHGDGDLPNYGVHFHVAGGNETLRDDPAHDATLIDQDYNPTTHLYTHTWEGVVNSVTAGTVVITFLADEYAESTRTLNVSVTLTGEVALSKISIDLPEIRAYANPNYRVLNPKVGGIEQAWGTIEAPELPKEVSGWWMGDGTSGAYSPMVAFYDKDTEQGAGIVAFNSALDPMQFAWTTEDDRVSPLLELQHLGGADTPHSYQIVQLVGAGMPDANSEFYRDNFLGPLMDDLAIDESMYETTPAVWAYGNTMTVSEPTRSADEWSEVILEPLEGEVAIIDLPVGGVWMWPRFGTGQPYEPYTTLFNWADDYAEVGAALESDNLGVLINPYTSFNYDQDREVVGDVIYENLSNPIVRQRLEVERNELDAMGVPLAFWDTGMTPHRSHGTVQDWIDILHSWASVGIHIGPEESNDIAAWITGAIVHFSGAHSGNDDDSSHYLWEGGNNAVAKAVTPDATQFLLAYEGDVGLQGELNDQGLYWWDVAIQQDMVPLMHWGLLRRWAAPTVTAAAFNAAANPDTVTITFDQAVSGLDVSDLEIESLTDPGVPITVSSQSYNSGTHTATFTLSGNLGPGIYRIRVVAWDAGEAESGITGDDNGFGLEYGNVDFVFDIEVV